MIISHDTESQFRGGLRSDHGNDLTATRDPNMSSFGGEVGSERNGFRRAQEELYHTQMHGPHLSTFVVKGDKEIGVSASVW